MLGKSKQWFMSIAVPKHNASLSLGRAYSDKTTSITLLFVFDKIGAPAIVVHFMFSGDGEQFFGVFVDQIKV